MSEVKTDSVVNVSGDNDSGIDLSTNDVVAIKTADTERMRVDSSGNVMVGTTNATPGVGNTTAGISLNSGDLLCVSRSADTAVSINRSTSDGTLVDFRKGGTRTGSIAILSSDNLFIGGLTGNTGGFIFNDAALAPAYQESNRDNYYDLGVSNARFDDIFATNSTIQTSDQNEKEQITSLTTAEMTAAKAISKLFKTFKWQDKVAAKGDAARTHAGVIAQEVQTAMTDAGLNAAHYAFWCSDTWWETDETYTDDDGVEQTRTNTYDTADEAPEGATQRTRLGIRYPELLAFIGAATEQRLADLETRVTALEDA